MKVRKQPILSLLFFTILVFPVIAIGILQIGQSYIKSTREERLETEKLVQVVIPANDVIWEEDGKELWVGERMFDVASLKIENGNCYLTGVFDDDETEMAGTLVHILFSEGNGQLLQLLMMLQCFAGCMLSIDFALRQLNKPKKPSFNLISFPSPPYLVLIPPPRQ